MLPTVCQIIKPLYMEELSTCLKSPPFKFKGMPLRPNSDSLHYYFQNVTHNLNGQRYVRPVSAKNIFSTITKAFIQHISSLKYWMVTESDKITSTFDTNIPAFH